jgi:hypothetical protein
LIALKLWHALPAATKKYIAEVERKGRTGPEAAPVPGVP